MAEVFEIELFSKKYMDFSIVLDALRQNEISCHINEFYIIDNWQYENKNVLQKSEDFYHYVENGKIGIVECQLANGSHGGCQVERVAENCYQTSLWISTEYNMNLSSSIIDCDNIEIYNAITTLIGQYMLEYGISIVALGVEMVVKSSASISEIVNQSHNVVKWIINSI